MTANSPATRSNAMAALASDASCALAVWRWRFVRLFDTAHGSTAFLCPVQPPLDASIGNQPHQRHAGIHHVRYCGIDESKTDRGRVEHQRQLAFDVEAERHGQG